MPLSVVMKASDETRNSTTAYAADSDLSMPVEAGKYYRMRLFALAYSGATPDIKYRIGCTATGEQITGMVFGEATIADQGGGREGEVHIQDNVGASSFIVNGSATTTSRARIYVDTIVYGGSAGGDVSLQWAQNTSDAGNTTIKAGAWMSLEEVFP
jgi:hypothetical protein